MKETSGGREKKGSIYEGGLRVPAIIEWPARKIKGRTGIPVSTSDIYPTLMAMAGVKLEAPHPLDGIDVSDIIAGTVEQRSKPLGFWHKFQGGQGTWSDRIQKAIMVEAAGRRAIAPRPATDAQGCRRVPAVSGGSRHGACRMERLAVEAAPHQWREIRAVQSGR